MHIQFNQYLYKSIIPVLRINFKGMFVYDFSARTRSQSGVMTLTITDYLNKMRARNMISEQEATIWLQGFSDDYDYDQSF